jgi:hypothetical protein
MKDKNKIPTPKSIDNSKILEEAAKKLEILEQKQKLSEFTNQQKEQYEAALKKMETQLKKKVQLDRLVTNGINEATVGKMELFFRNLSAINIEVLKKAGNLQKSHREVQTEQEDIGKLKTDLSNLEKENDEFKMKKLKYKKDIELLKNELKEYKENNEKLIKENKHLNYNLEELNNVKLVLEGKLEESKREKEGLLEKLKKTDNTIEDYNKLKDIMEEKIQNERERVELEDRNRHNFIELFRGDIRVLVYLKLLNNVTQYLKPIDIVNLKLTGTVFRDEIDSNLDCTKQFYSKLCKKQYKKIKELSNIDVRKEYSITENEIEQLITE